MHQATAPGRDDWQKQKVTTCENVDFKSCECLNQLVKLEASKISCQRPERLKQNFDVDDEADENELHSTIEMKSGR